MAASPGLAPALRRSLIAACLLGALAVALGAFGAHALRESFDDRAEGLWRTANQYHFWHSLALLGCASLGGALSQRLLSAAVLAYVAGVLLFSGSLYLLALGGPRGLGLVTPFGGVALMLGWLLVLAAALRR